MCFLTQFPIYLFLALAQEYTSLWVVSEWFWWHGHWATGPWIYIWQTWILCSILYHKATFKESLCIIEMKEKKLYVTLINFFTPIIIHPNIKTKTRCVWNTIKVLNPAVYFFSIFGWRSSIFSFSSNWHLHFLSNYILFTWLTSTREKMLSDTDSIICLEEYSAFLLNRKG